MSIAYGGLCGVPNLMDSYRELRRLKLHNNNLGSCTNDTVYDGNFWRLGELVLPFNGLITLPGIVYAAVVTLEKSTGPYIGFKQHSFVY